MTSVKRCASNPGGYPGTETAHDAPGTTCSLVLLECVLRVLGVRAGKVSQISKCLLVTENRDMLPPVGDRKPKENFEQGDGIKQAYYSWFLLFIRLEAGTKCSRRITKQ